ncbi:PAS domain S-box protein [Desulfobacula sp.]|uniref:PAS domain-containing sensor histidine kinase n=1 Tax=Desulfobacula sp. TaxID=2593537 RepID=UPI00260AD5A2|nr:PAS domain S-box protein [Desulfobacula sp.]
MSLTDAEKEWLEGHSDEKFVFTRNNPPALLVDEDGSMSGILNDILDVLNVKLGTNFGIIIINDHAKVTEMLQTHQVAGALAIAQGMGGYYKVLESQPVYTTYPVVFARAETSVKPDSLEEIEGKTISVSQSSGWAKKLLELFKDRVDIIETVTPLEALQLLYKGKVDYMIGTSTHTYFISAHQLIGLHPAHILTDQPVRAVMGVRDDWPILAGIIDKGLASISKKEMTAIYNQWAQLPKQQKTIELTKEEQSWLSTKHKVRVSSGNFPPFVINQGKKVSGIVIDYLNLVAQRTGIIFDYIDPGIPFAERLEEIKSLNGPVDLIPCMMKTPERETYMSFSKAYFDTPRMIFTQKEMGVASGLADFAEKKIAVVRQTVVQQEIEGKYPGIQLLLYNSDLDAMKAVSKGKVDGYVGNMVLASYLILQHGLVNLAIAAPTDLENHIFSFGSRRDWPQLSRILDKGMDSITPEEKMAIRGKYLSVRYEHGIRSADVVRWILMFTGAGIAIVLMFFVWNRTLKKQVRERTTKLSYHATLLENVSDAVISTDLDFRIISWNSAAYQIYGWKAQEVIGKTLQEVFQMEHAHIKKQEMLATVRDTGKWQGELRQTIKNGATIDIHATVSRVFDDKGKTMGFVGVNRDITGQKRSQRRLVESETRFRATFEQAAVGIAHVGAEGVFLRVNQKFCDIIGYSHEETLALTFQEITHPDDLDTDLAHVDQLLKGEEDVYSMEKRYLRKQGEVFWVYLTVSLVRDDAGAPLFFVSVIKDISARKNLQEELTIYQTRLKALASKLTLLEEKERKRISMELHDHIGQTLAFCRIQVAKATKYAPRQGEQAAILAELSQSLLDTIRDTKDLVFDLSSPLLNELGLAEAIAHFLKNQVHKKHGIKTEFIDDKKTALMNSDLSAILFRNVRELITNTIKHARATTVIVSMGYHGNELKLSVSDDGIGFDPDEKFIPANADSRFGLFSIKERIEDFGGSFKIISSPGKGCQSIMMVPFINQSN